MTNGRLGAILLIARAAGIASVAAGAWLLLSSPSLWASRAVPVTDERG